MEPLRSARRYGKRCAEHNRRRKALYGYGTASNACIEKTKEMGKNFELVAGAYTLVAAQNQTAKMWTV